MKKVVIVVRALPFNTERNSEALRCAVGMTIEEENRIKVIFIDNGVWTAASLDSKAAQTHELDKHMETLCIMEVDLIAEDEALTDRGLKVSRKEIITKPRQSIDQTIKEADVVMAF
jgi:tRNA 2-thiouridine synthesizing protein C